MSPKNDYDFEIERENALGRNETMNQTQVRFAKGSSESTHVKSGLG